MMMPGIPMEMPRDMNRREMRRHMREMQREYGLVGEPDVNVLARLPGAMQVSRAGVSDEMLKGVEQALDQALEALLPRLDVVIGAHGLTFETAALSSRGSTNGNTARRFGAQ